MLSKTGLIDLYQEISDSPLSYSSSLPHLRNAIHAHLRVSVTYENKIYNIYYDTHDSYEIDQTHLETCDFYFKRSYDSKYILESHLNSYNKIFPLGLNYLVFSNSIDFFAFKRNFLLNKAFVKKIDQSIRAVDFNNYLTFNPRLRDIQSFPNTVNEPKVLFMVTAYDPYDSLDREKDKIEERIYNNEFRANCIRELRKEFGKFFYGGFMHNNFTIDRYRDLLIDNSKNGRKDIYLKNINEYSIGVATTGLHNSIGWKFAEYIAFSKAIVSEKLHYSVPGDLSPNNNYLEFNSPIECVEKVALLFDNKELREQMMFNNAQYYHHYVRPDALVLNTLLKIFNIKIEQ
jgi:hypothetical protein